MNERQRERERERVRVNVNTNVALGFRTDQTSMLAIVKVDPA